MNAATKTQQISKESAAEIAAHLSAVLNHPETPSDLYNAIGEEVCAMSNDLTTRDYADSPEYIKMVLFANINGELPEAAAQRGTVQQKQRIAPDIKCL
jgi:hypothetical protein